MKERFNSESLSKQNPSLENVLTQARDEDVKLKLEADRQLFNNTDPKAPVELLRKRGEAFVELSESIKANRVGEVPEDWMEELGNCTKMVRVCLEEKDDAALSYLLSPSVEITTKSGKKTARIDNRIQMLTERLLLAKNTPKI